MSQTIKQGINRTYTAKPLNPINPKPLNPKPLFVYTEPQAALGRGLATAWTELLKALAVSPAAEAGFRGVGFRVSGLLFRD